MIGRIRGQEGPAAASVPVALTIAGSDSSGGAGIQADLKTFAALGVHGASALTSVTAQNTCGVEAVHVVPPDVVAAQVRAVTDDVRVDAVKIGMLATAEVAATVHESVRALRGHDSRTPLVILDPVMVATSGDRLLDADAVARVRALAGDVDAVTPNLPEAAVLLGEDGSAPVEQQARRLADTLGTRVLLKGGHASGPEVVDVWVGADGQARRLRAGRVETAHTHGTGCTLSAALAAHLARGRGWDDAVTEARAWLLAALRAGRELTVGRGTGPVHHLHEWWPAAPGVS